MAIMMNSSNINASGSGSKRKHSSGATIQNKRITGAPVLARSINDLVNSVKTQSKELTVNHVVSDNSYTIAEVVAQLYIIQGLDPVDPLLYFRPHAYGHSEQSGDGYEYSHEPRHYQVTAVIFVTNAAKYTYPNMPDRNDFATLNDAMMPGDDDVEMEQVRARIRAKINCGLAKFPSCDIDFPMDTKAMDMNLLESLVTSTRDVNSDKMLLDKTFDEFASLWMNMKVEVKTKEDHEARQFKFKPRAFKIENIMEIDISTLGGSLENEILSEWQELLSDEKVA
ncbi:Midasin [Camellia lanceoleosa]|uniref:Midasin n=1 Tax=Camellia lanceoleosa TaxID=1840588 RepID=A0ACC0IIB9_9ERIC|nr:Midasin [Camellia lanceoleosa]